MNEQQFSIPENVNDAVTLAVSIISEELQSGLYWNGKHPHEIISTNPDDITSSSSKENEERTLNNTNEESTTSEDRRAVSSNSSPSLQEFPEEHVRQFSQALYRFASDVIIPSMKAQGIDLNKGGRRAFIASCVMLREVLVTNAAGIFYPKVPSNIMDGDVQLVETNDDKLDRLFQDSLVVTTLILMAIQSLNRKPIIDETNNTIQMDSEASSGVDNDSNVIYTILDEFAQLVSDYHNRNGSLAQIERFLPRLDCRYTGVYPNGEKMSQEESKAWRISFNLVRDQHFFAGINRDQGPYGSGGHEGNDGINPSTRTLKQQRMREVVPPEPNMVATYIVPKQNKIQEED